MSLAPSSALRLAHPPTGPRVGQWGGLPHLAPYQEWPLNHHGEPLTFLGELDLEALHQVQPLPAWMPHEGRLVFFYDTTRQPWGGDPHDRAGWRLWHVPAEAETCEAPEALTALPERPLGAEPFVSIPSPYKQGSETAVEDWDAFYLDLPEARHQFLGYPVPIQEDVGEDLVAERHPETTRKDWALLLQIDSDGDMDWTWGDSGTLHIYVQPQRVSKGEWAHAELVLDCY